jgi:hypothetical protein
LKGRTNLQSKGMKLKNAVRLITDSQPRRYFRNDRGKVEQQLLGFLTITRVERLVKRARQLHSSLRNFFGPVKGKVDEERFHAFAQFGSGAGQLER